LGLHPGREPLESPAGLRRAGAPLHAAAGRAARGRADPRRPRADARSGRQRRPGCAAEPGGRRGPPARGRAAAVNQPLFRAGREFFPETWFWEELTTDDSGRAAKRVEAPDSITTWMCRAVALSPTKGLGIGEAQLRVFQPFFAQIDLPYAAIRGEVFPAKVAL